MRRAECFSPRQRRPYCRSFTPQFDHQPRCFRMNRRRALLLLALPLGGWLGQRLVWPTPRHQRGISLRALLGDSAEFAEFSRAISKRDFKFPIDHAPHPEFRHEWWYFTGNLETATKRPFGFQLTFFRLALTARPRLSLSGWRGNQLLLGHFAITDVQAQHFHADERQHRSALEIAGTSTAPPSVWIKNWKVAITDGENHDWRLTAQTETHGLALDLISIKAPILQGDRGLSQKGNAVGNASYYYSQPRLNASGALTLAGVDYPVTGTAWVDREWGSGALEVAQEGWDWFGLQFTNYSELMFYRLRRTDSTPDPHSSGIWIDPDGKGVALNHTEVSLSCLDTWTSPNTGVRYPQRWRIDIPKLHMRLAITPRVAAQEWRGRVVYWEGAVEVSGTSNQAALTGVGYAEFTGYLAR
ncbi:MAG: carotenoid 1,2-hydratase [Gammaproteobacteria bacterium]|nr:carotenoid 1,2-hydratase [Gammaproteobacteria bacterium]